MTYTGIVVRKFSVYITLTAFFLLITHVLFYPESKYAAKVITTGLLEGDPGYVVNVLAAVGAGLFSIRGNIGCYEFPSAIYNYKKIVH